MEFFKKLITELRDCKSVTLTVAFVGDKITVGFLPTMQKGAENKLSPLTLTGFAEELDEGFFTQIKEYVVMTKGIQSNLESLKEKAVKKEEPKKEVKPAAKKPDAKKAKPATEEEASEEEEEENNDPEEEQLSLLDA